LPKQKRTCEAGKQSGRGAERSREVGSSGKDWRGRRVTGREGEGGRERKRGETERGIGGKSGTARDRERVERG
jgi:hypothetical protein